MRKLQTLSWMSVMVATAGLTCVAPVWAQQPTAPAQPNFDPSDVYYQAWLFTREAATLEKEGRYAESLAKLRSAERFFETIHRYRPEWKKQMVDDRLSITKAQITKTLPKAQEQQQKENVAVAELEGGVPLNVRPMDNNAQTPNVAIEDARVRALETEVQRLRQALASPANESSRNASRASDLEKQRNELSMQLKKSTADLEALRAKLATAPVQSEMEKLNQRLRSLEQEREAMGMALSQSRTEQLQSKATINKLSADFQAMRQQAADLERNLKVERDKSNQVTSAQMKQLQELQSTIKQKDAEITAANNRVASLEKELLESQQASQELRTERDDLLRERDHMSALLKLSESGRMQQLIERNMSLAKELREAKERVDRINKDNDETKDELTEALRDLAITKTKIIGLQTEKRAQDQRMSELEMQLKNDEKSLASGESGANDEETKTLRDIIQRQLRVQERRKQAAQLLLDAAKKKSSTGDETYDEAVAMLNEEVTLTPEEQSIVDETKVDGEIYSPTYAGSKERVNAATTEMHEQIENYTKAAVRAFGSQRLSASREVLEMILDIHPGHVPTMTKLGIVQMRLDDPIGAANTLRTAVENDETRPLSHRLLGLALYRSGDLTNAETSVRRAVEIDPSDAAAHTILANTLFRLKRAEEAETCYKKAIELNPEAPEALHNYALLLQRAGRNKEALDFYNKSLTNGGQPNPKLESDIAKKLK